MIFEVYPEYKRKRECPVKKELFNPDKLFLLYKL